MRGGDRNNGSLFSYVDLEERVPKAHPLRIIRGIVNDVLGSLSSNFEVMYSRMGRPLLPPHNSGKQKRNRVYLKVVLKMGAGHAVGMAEEVKRAAAISTLPTVY